MRYLFIIFLVILLVIFNAATVDVGVMMALPRFCDLASLAFVIVIAIPIVIVTGLHTDFINAFRFAIGKTKAKSILELKRAKEATILAGRTIVSAGIISTCLGAITVLYEADTLDILGSNLAVCLLCSLYAALFYLLLVPIRSKLEVLIAEFMQG